MNDQPQKKSGCLLYGCIGAIVLAILAGGGLYFGAKKLISGAAEAVYNEISADMENMDLTDDERIEADRLLVQLRDGMQSGEIGFTDLPVLLEAVENSDLKEYAALLTGKQVINSNADLTDEEKSNGTKQMSRFVDGMSKNRFGENEFEDLLSTIGTQADDGTIRIDEAPTADQLREMIQKAQAMSDEAGLGPDGLEINFVEELRTLVDEVMGPKSDG